MQAQYGSGDWHKVQYELWSNGDTNNRNILKANIHCYVNATTGLTYDIKFKDVFGKKLKENIQK